MLQNPSASIITSAQTEDHVRKIFRIILTRARARQASPAGTVKVVSCHVTFLLYTRPDCLSETLGVV